MPVSIRDSSYSSVYMNNYFGLISDENGFMGQILYANLGIDIVDVWADDNGPGGLARFEIKDLTEESKKLAEKADRIMVGYGTV